MAKCSVNGRTWQTGTNSSVAIRGSAVPKSAQTELGCRLRRFWIVSAKVPREKRFWRAIRLLSEHIRAASAYGGIGPRRAVAAERPLLMMSGPDGKSVRHGLSKDKPEALTYRFGTRNRPFILTSAGPKTCRGCPGAWTVRASS